MIVLSNGYVVGIDCCEALFKLKEMNVFVVFMSLVFLSLQLFNCLLHEIKDSTVSNEKRGLSYDTLASITHTHNSHATTCIYMLIYMYIFV